MIRDRLSKDITSRNKAFFIRQCDGGAASDRALCAGKGGGVTSGDDQHMGQTRVQGQS